MINPTRSSTPVSQRTELRSREIQLFEPPADAFYTIEATSRIVDVPRRRILVYCKYHLLSPATNTTSHGYYFDRDAIRSLRRIEALRTVCGDDFAGIKMILDLTAALERLRSDIRLLSRARSVGSSDKSDRKAASAPRRRIDMRSSSRRKWK
jgi:DNA-binding transcriptional MerR regulator